MTDMDYNQNIDEVLGSIGEPKVSYGPIPEKSWRVIRKNVLERDDFECQRCGFQRFNGRGLSVHHIIPREEGGGYHGSNLITLCNKCHDYVEYMDLRTAVEITTTDDPIEYLEEVRGLEKIIAVSKIERPEWHKWVYGGQMRPTQYPQFLADAKKQPLERF